MKAGMGLLFYDLMDIGEKSKPDDEPRRWLNGWARAAERAYRMDVLCGEEEEEFPDTMPLSYEFIESFRWGASCRPMADDA